MLKICAVLLFAAAVAVHGRSYEGYQVLSAVPKNLDQVQLILALRNEYGVDLWNEPRQLGEPVLFHLRPGLLIPIKELFKKNQLEYEVRFDDVESLIRAEQVMHAPTNVSHSSAGDFDFGRYHYHDDVIDLLKDLAKKHPNLATLEVAGNSYERRPIYNLKITSGKSTNKPAILIECGLHAREWTSVAVGAYFVNKLLTTYDSDPAITALLDKYEINIIVMSNPDGYIFTWIPNGDRFWRKTRSRSIIDSRDACKGVDANRNFDIEFCGVGTSRKPCEEIYCGDAPFSENESKILRDLMIKLRDRLKAYFSIHAYSQYWMSSYGISKKLPSNYDELMRVGKAGITALKKRYGTDYKLGTIANVIYEAAGSSVDYAYEVQGVKIAFALEVRDNGRFGFFLPKKYIIPTCEETTDGLLAAIEALK